MSGDAPILEFDPDPVALIEPGEVYRKRQGSIPPVAVLCFFAEVLEEIVASDDVELVTHLVAAHGSHPIHAIGRGDAKVAVFHPGVGAPLAAGFLEEAIALGARTVVACGGAGAVAELAAGDIVIPTSALRDEGTSYHYMAPSRTVDADPVGVGVARAALERRGISYREGMTWTTDGLYRETKGRIERRKAEGCITVEMEAAAFFAVARFRGIRFAQLLYAGDDVSGDTWDSRAWTTSPSRALTFDLAVEIALELDRVT
ncbi:MAG TPA: nucleoside phosphorylase [Acidimicrobiales bacterium]|nr:nucleoside phosphorylase [Acidimicrobiales bacterium]